MPLVLLAACGVPGARAVPPLAGGPDAGGPAAVELAGQSYLVDALSPRPGAMLTITRAPVAFGYADGAEAKRAVVAYCTGRNLRLSPDVLGHFVAGAWLFREGCV